MDARRSQAYYGIYKVNETVPIALTQSAAAPIEEIISKINELDKKTIFVGDGVPVFREELEAKLTIPYEWAADSVRYQKAASIASLGRSYETMGKSMPAGQFAPVYFRLSQAERERLEREKQEKN